MNIDCKKTRFDSTTGQKKLFSVSLSGMEHDLLFSDIELKDSAFGMAGQK